MLEELNAIAAILYARGASGANYLTQSFAVANMCFKLQGLQVCVQI